MDALSEGVHSDRQAHRQRMKRSCARGLSQFRSRAYSTEAPASKLMESNHKMLSWHKLGPDQQSIIPSGSWKFSSTALPQFYTIRGQTEINPHVTAA